MSDMALQSGWRADLADGHAAILADLAKAKKDAGFAEKLYRPLILSAGTAALGALIPRVIRSPLGAASIAAIPVAAGAMVGFSVSAYDLLNGEASAEKITQNFTTSLSTGLGVGATLGLLAFGNVTSFRGAFAVGGLVSSAMEVGQAVLQGRSLSPTSLALNAIFGGLGTGSGLAIGGVVERFAAKPLLARLAMDMGFGGSYDVVSTYLEYLTRRVAHVENGNFAETLSLNLASGALVSALSPQTVKRAEADSTLISGASFLAGTWIGPHEIEIPSARSALMRHFTSQKTTMTIPEIKQTLSFVEIPREKIPANASGLIQSGGFFLQGQEGPRYFLVTDSARPRMSDDHKSLVMGHEVAESLGTSAQLAHDQAHDLATLFELGLAQKRGHLEGYLGHIAEHYPQKMSDLERGNFLARPGEKLTAIREAIEGLASTSKDGLQPIVDIASEFTGTTQPRRSPSLFPDQITAEWSYALERAINDRSMKPIDLNELADHALRLLEAPAQQGHNSWPYAWRHFSKVRAELSAVNRAQLDRLGIARVAACPSDPGSLDILRRLNNYPGDFDSSTLRRIDALAIASLSNPELHCSLTWPYLWLNTSRRREAMNAQERGQFRASAGEWLKGPGFLHDRFEEVLKRLIETLPSRTPPADEWLAQALKWIEQDGFYNNAHWPYIGAIVLRYIDRPIIKARRQWVVQEGARWIKDHEPTPAWKYFCEYLLNVNCRDYDVRRLAANWVDQHPNDDPFFSAHVLAASEEGDPWIPFLTKNVAEKRSALPEKDQTRIDEILVLRDLRRSYQDGDPLLASVTLPRPGDRSIIANIGPRRCFLSIDELPFLPSDLSSPLRVLVSEFGTGEHPPFLSHRRVLAQEEMRQHPNTYREGGRISAKVLKISGDYVVVGTGAQDCVQATSRVSSPSDYREGQEIQVEIEQIDAHKGFMRVRFR